LLSDQALEVRIVGLETNALSFQATVVSGETITLRGQVGTMSAKKEQIGWTHRSPYSIEHERSQHKAEY
jgi:hypothetical protein